VGLSLRKWRHKPNRDGASGRGGGTVGIGIVTGGASCNVQLGAHDGEQSCNEAVFIAAINAVAKNNEYCNGAETIGFSCVNNTLQSILS